MDVAGEPVPAPQGLGHPGQAFHGRVGAAGDPRREKQPFDVIALVEFKRDGDHFFNGKGGAGNVIAAAVDAVGAVVLAIIGQQNLEQGDATAVIGPAVADAAHGRAAQAAGGRFPPRAAGRAGSVVAGGFAENGDFAGKIHTG